MPALRLTLSSAAVVLATSLVALACSLPPGADAPGTPGPEDNGGASGSSGAGGTFGEGSSGSGGTNADGSCAASVAKTAKAKVDIVFVIDNSGSMDQEMLQIRQNVNRFASKIGGIGLDYTVTLITKKAKSAAETGTVICVPPPLGGANCGDNPPTFFHLDQDVGSEDSLSLILSTYPSWSSHLRTDATKVFVEVTDDESEISSAAFDTQLLAKTPAGTFGTAAKRNYVFHSIISKPAGTAAPSAQKCAGAAGSSLEYQKLSTLTSGLMDEVCKTDYSAVLDNIAKGIVEKLGCELSYPSVEAADPTKVVVTFTPQGAAAQTLTQVTDVSKCGSVTNAWYYDEPSKPTRIILCPSACGVASSSSTAKIEALVGCKGAAPK